MSEQRKDKKIPPANVPLPPGVESELLQGCTVPCGSQLTAEHLASMNVGGHSLSDAEKQVFIDIPYCRVLLFHDVSFSGLFDAVGNGNTMSGRRSFGFDSCLLFLAFCLSDFSVS